ncbi:hypothetical protein BC938DRAFT_482442, partial [Jimgerdemannia flammicorona]
MGSPIE